MYLTCALLQHAKQQDYADSCPKSSTGGPDVLIEHAGRRIWIEAVTATDGEAGKPDSITPPELGKASTVPDDKIILRYRSAIRAKHIKHADYLSNGIVSPVDPYIIAVNGYALSYGWADAEIPRILKAVFPLGQLEFTFDRDTRTLTGARHQFRSAIYKRSGADVSTDLFMNREYNCVSAVLHSCANACMTAGPLGGADFLLIHNPLAANSLPRKIIRSRREYTAMPDKDGYLLEYVETD
jgi:type I restriction enzyme S subunit